MFIPSHIASGYLIGKFMKTSSWTVYPFMPILLFASLLPDVDGLFSDTVAGHHTILHTPIFWIILFGGMILIHKWLKMAILQPVSLGIFLGVQLHLITDWITARTVGIQWLYPF
ncbi:MAG: metal-dependent hydrolase, partial [Candidatus Marinimicrobia bacterium]|nr:metal-dependent hydrolase [Candidatus Neomarinimicrobiota bacterium]MBT4053518.1 metal-dependent hydrolase [Candidatus Neomarinimicrobiota bacterium]MBT6516308.1 metal-dependent hydrolase [Candidatus Neomarinimicrobiota bacterium]MBT6710362.1 metal-dependent hydrolase [Candidatus Neomarinimicrobiota bacterium]MBT6981488.1 metal-dependent hydrolase [Candidatus Neomarinimicrobiota bacterium]